jgi:hypothetical protein
VTDKPTQLPTDPDDESASPPEEGGERPDQGLPGKPGGIGGPGRPDQGLPGRGPGGPGSIGGPKPTHPIAPTPEPKKDKR